MAPTAPARTSDNGPNRTALTPWTPVSTPSAAVLDHDRSSDHAALRDFLAELAENGLSGRTARAYLGHLGRLAAWLRAEHGAALLEATSHDLRAWRAALMARQAPSSVNAALAALRRFYRWSTSEGLTDRDPTTRLKPASQQPLSPQGFTPTERHRLRREAERASPGCDAIVTVLLETGLRVGELVALRWERVTLRPRSGWMVVTGKSEKRRQVPLNLEARSALEAIRHGTESGPVFRSRRGPYSDRGVRHLLASLARRAGVEHVHPHRFRHDVARRLVEVTDLPTVATWLGHERLETTRRYAQPDAAALERAAEKLGEG